MPVFSRIQDDVVVLVVDGDFTPQELRRAGEQGIGHADAPSPTRVLLDMSGAAGLARKGIDELKQTAAVFVDMGERLEAVAVLAPDDVTYGLLRMGEGMFAPRGGGMSGKAFRDRGEALAWLAER